MCHPTRCVPWCVSGCVIGCVIQAWHGHPGLLVSEHPMTGAAPLNKVQVWAKPLSGAGERPEIGVLVGADATRPATNVVATYSESAYSD